MIETCSSELVAVIKKPDGPYDYFSLNVKGFISKVEFLEKQGFEGNPDAYFLAMWVRERLSDLLIRQGSYNLHVHPIELPNDINAVIKLEEKRKLRLIKKHNQISHSLIFFPNPKLRAFALERVQMLHQGRHRCVFIFIGC